MAGVFAHWPERIVGVGDRGRSAPSRSVGHGKRRQVRGRGHECGCGRVGRPPKTGGRSKARRSVRLADHDGRLRPQISGELGAGGIWPGREPRVFAVLVAARPTVLHVRGGPASAIRALGASTRVGVLRPTASTEANGFATANPSANVATRICDPQARRNATDRPGRGRPEGPSPGRAERAGWASQRLYRAHPASHRNDGVAVACRR